ncbi:MAG: site-specific tyrosine recombinase/integron integrase [bacterium]
MSKNKEGDFFQLVRELTTLNYSRKTVKSYIFYNRQLLSHSKKSAKAINTEDIKQYLGRLSKEKSPSTVSVALNAIQFYYKNILKRSFFLHIRHPKKKSKLPTVLSTGEVKKILSVVRNPKHSCIISLLYGTGIRVSELVKIKIKDIDFDRNILHIRQGKGNKDRLAILPAKLLEILKTQARVKSANDYLFTNGRGYCLTTRTIAKVVKNLAVSAGISKNVSPHSFRHSFATHLLESGTDIRHIQELLGHAKLETTQGYTKVATNNIQKIKSPLDSI